MSKSGILKSGWVVMNQQNTRVIDTNAMVEYKLKELADKLAIQTSDDSDFADGFTQGLDAQSVADLVGEGQIYGGGVQETPQEETMPDDLIAQAREEIENMKQQALAEIEEARKQALEEGRQEGYQKGLEEGKQEGYAAGQQEGFDSVTSEREQALSEVENMHRQLEEEYQRKLDELEPKFIDTLTGIYEHIFKVSLKNSRELIVHLIANTMRNIEGSNDYLIHVSKDDYPFVSMEKKELVKGTGIAVDAVDIIEDSTLGRNECMIETGNGVFDCSLGTQLEALNEELRLLAYDPEHMEEL